MPDANTRLIPEASSAAIRCYGQGLGDCFLLAFPRKVDLDNPFYLVIDCGVAHGTPDEEARMQAVVADIHDATGGHLDVLAVTHQHYDHVIGFVHAEALWKTFQIERVFAPWTEKPGDPDAATIGKAALRLTAEVSRAGSRAAGLAAGDDAGGRLTDGQFAIGGESFSIGSAAGIKQGWANALSLCPQDQIVYCEPGDVFTLGDTGVNAYVLGPPRFKDRDGKALVGDNNKPLVYLLEDRDAMYSYEQFGLEPDHPGVAASTTAQPAGIAQPSFSVTSSLVARALIGGGSEMEESFNRYSPFDPTLRVEWDDALDAPFFKEHYAADNAWRGVDFDWLDGASEMALRAGGFTNNISLVLAFELPDSKKVLLFVGDAQVGNWLSWQKIGNWWPAGAAQSSGPAEVDELLARVAFYKVGHHGSHNATIRAHGLDAMTNNPIAYIPVSVPIAQDIMGYCPMPFYPVLRALQDKTSGAVFMANGKLLEPLPDHASRDKLEAGVRRSEEMLPEKVRNKGKPTEAKLEGAVPLWTEFTIAD